MNILKGKGILLPIQRELLVELGKMNDASFFYLTGGTALSEFYLAHRRSYDLDFFTSKLELILPFTKTLEEKLAKEQYTLRVIHRFESFVEYEIEKKGESTILHFACDSPFRFEEPQPSDFSPIFSLSIITPHSLPQNPYFSWIPACAGMTNKNAKEITHKVSVDNGQKIIKI